jgi:hypothetical protein
MAQSPNIDGVLIQWGDRLFYPGNRVVKVKPQPRLDGNAQRQRAAAIRERIEATVVRRAPQVMVKVTGGGRGIPAIAAHFRYISKNGQLDMEDERGETMRGREAVYALTEDWRLSGSQIEEVGYRREAFNIMLSMPRGTDPLIVQRAAREFAQIELSDHKYVMVLHDHQANPHVHISVRAESMHGRRLNPRKADLQRWRETFAEKLRGYGVEAEGTRQATRGRSKNHESLWRIKANEDGRLRTNRPETKSGTKAFATRQSAVEAWSHIDRALAVSGDRTDAELAQSITTLLREFGSEPSPNAPASERNVAQPDVKQDRRAGR